METNFLNPEPVLSEIIVETTTACNIKCIHCAVSNEGYVIRMLRYESFESIIPIMKNHKPLVKLNGHGETLAHKHFFEMLDASISAGCRVVFQTNATLLVPDVSKRLLAYAGPDKLVSMSISIDGVGDVFNTVRRKADWEEYVNNITTFRNLRAASGSPFPYLNFQFTAMLLNIHTLPAVVAMVKELGGSAITVGDLQEYPTAAGQSITRDLVYAKPFFEEARRVAENLGIGFEPFPSLIEEMASVPHDCKAALPPKKTEYATPTIVWKTPKGDQLADVIPQQRSSTPAADLSGTAKPETKESCPEAETLVAPQNSATLSAHFEIPDQKGLVKVKDCTDPWKFAFIQADGGVRPCCWIPYTMGNINTQSFETIWYSKDYKDLRAAVASPNPPSECWRCQARGWKWIPKPRGYSAGPQLTEVQEISEVIGRVHEGHVDHVDADLVLGWAWSPEYPDKPVSVDLYVDGAYETSIPATAYRPDLEHAGKGNGRHAFQLRLPDRYCDGRNHIIKICYHKTNTELYGSPRSIVIAPGPNRGNLSGSHFS